MSYQVQHTVDGDTLRIALSGSVDNGSVGNLANDVIALGHHQPTQRVLIDVRALADDVHAFNVLHLVNRYPGASRLRRVAVLELPAQAKAHEFHETAATNRGFTLRHFTDAAQAAAWLQKQTPRRTP